MGLDWQHGAMSIAPEKGDVVIVCGAPRTLSTLAIILKARMAGAKVIWWGHFWSSTTKPWRFRLRMLFLKACHGVLFYTENEVSEYRSMVSNAPKPLVSALNNGLDLKSIENSRLPYVASDRPADILFIGRLTEKARLELLLDAISKVDDREVHLHVIGAGSLEAIVKQHAQDLNLEGRVTWHGAIADEVQIGRIANRCRAFVYPGEVGLSVIHAMAYQLPAIVHDDRWRHMPEIAAFEAKSTGVTFEREDSDSLAGAINRLLCDTETLDRYSAKSRSIVENTFNTEDMADRFSSMIGAVTAID